MLWSCFVGCPLSSMCAVVLHGRGLLFSVVVPLTCGFAPSHGCEKRSPHTQYCVTLKRSMCPLMAASSFWSNTWGGHGFRGGRSFFGNDVALDSLRCFYPPSFFCLFLLIFRVFFHFVSLWLGIYFVRLKMFTISSFIFGGALCQYRLRRSPGP